MRVKATDDNATEKIKYILMGILPARSLRLALELDSAAEKEAQVA
jgi:hypothetical protein